MQDKRSIKILLIAVSLAVILICGGFAVLYFNGFSGISGNTEPMDGQIKVACVGDSITYGHGISGWYKNNYPAVLQELLGEDYHVNNYGASGSAVQTDSDQSYTVQMQYYDSLNYDADIVVFMMGTNDSKPENWKGADAFRKDLTDILDSYGDSQMYLCTPAAAFFLDGQTEGVTNFDIQPLIVEEIAQIIRELAAERGYVLVDIHKFTSIHPEWFEQDGVHPNNEGAAEIADMIYSNISQ